MNIPLVEDDLELDNRVRIALEEPGMTVPWRRRAADAAQALDGKPMDLVFPDLGLPDGDGLGPLARRRTDRDATPVLILAAGDASADRVAGLGRGADDDLIEPCVLAERVSRLRALARRNCGLAGKRLELRNRTLHQATMRVTADRQPVELSRAAFDLLCLLVERADRVLARRLLEQQVLPDGRNNESNVLDVHISNLRGKIGAGLMRSVRGESYVIDRQGPPPAGGPASLLWLAALADFVNDTARHDESFEPRLAGPRADLNQSVVDALAHDPDNLAAKLARIDAFQRRENHEEGDPALRQSMLVWQGERLLHISHVSPGEPDVLPTTQEGHLQRITVAGIPGRTCTQSSQVSNARVTLIRSGHTMNIVLALGGRDILILPLLISLPLPIVPARWSVRMTLRPWRRFSDEIASRGADDLTPLKFDGRYRVLQPVARAVNGLLQRVHRSPIRERSFIAGAAHEVRTPPAALRVNVEALQRRPRPARADELLAGLVRSTERASRRDEQRIRGEREALTSAIDNLDENAIKYSPAGSTAAASVTRPGHALEFGVVDRGSGIPDALRERVFTRFLRAPDQARPGSGMSLAIVGAVADRHGAQVKLAAAAAGTGLQASVSFTLA